MRTCWGTCTEQRWQLDMESSYCNTIHKQSESVTEVEQLAAHQKLSLDIEPIRRDEILRYGLSSTCGLGSVSQQHNPVT